MALDLPYLVGGTLRPVLPKRLSRLEQAKFYVVAALAAASFGRIATMSGQGPIICGHSKAFGFGSSPCRGQNRLAGAVAVFFLRRYLPPHFGQVLI